MFKFVEPNFNQEWGMEKNSFYNLFLDLLKEAFDFENQIVENLPKVIQKVIHKDLKVGLNEHLEETRQQVQRLKTIFKLLNENPTGRSCIVMKDIFNEGDALCAKELNPSTKDACIIISCQKVEHYEITCYGSLCALANCLRDWQKDERIDFDEVIDLLQASLDEEKEADEKLTEIAEGSFFTTGINEEARYEADQNISSLNQNNP